MIVKYEGNIIEHQTRLSILFGQTISYWYLHIPILVGLIRTFWNSHLSQVAVDAKERTLDRWIHWCHTDLFSVNKLVSGEDFPKKTNPLNVSMYIYIYVYIYVCYILL